MGCGSSSQATVDPDAKKESSSLKTAATVTKMAGDLATSIPVVGTLAGACLGCIAIILNTIDASMKMPDYLRQCRSKLVHVQALLTNFEDKKLVSSGITVDFFEDLKFQLEDFRTFVEEKLKKSQTKSKIESMMNVFCSSFDMEKTNNFRIQIDAALQKFLIAKINDDISDTFPDFLKKLYKNKPGYDTWRNLFGNKEQKKIDAFISRFSIHNEIDQNATRQIAEYIDKDKNQNISFEEYMAFIDFYIYYFDEKGSRIRKLEMLLHRIKEDNATLDTVKISERKIQYPDGTIYEGDISDGQRHGKGKLTKGQFYTYEGEFKKDIKQGYGVEIKNSSKYEGEWSNNQKNGKGKLTYQDGSVYEGQFKGDLPEGQGKLVSEEGNIYEGLYFDGSMIEGKILFKNGERYEGQTKDTKFRHGRGRTYDAQGKLSFEGNFQENVPSQKFTYYKLGDKETIEKNKNDITNIEIDLDTYQEHDPTLLANLKKLNVLAIKFSSSSYPHEFKELAIQFINNMNEETIGNITDFHLVIPNEQMIKLDLQDFRDVFAIVKKFSNVILLDLSLQFWGAGNEAVDGTIIDELIETYQTFKNLKYLTLNLHQWGYQNRSLKNEEVVSIIKGLEEFEEQEQLIAFNLDLGRWGVDTYDSYQFLTDFTMGKMGDLIKNQRNLEELSLNLRSWCYKNELITNMGVSELCQGIAKLKKLRKLELLLRGLAYDNKITQDALSILAKNISKLQNLEIVIINLEICYNFNDLQPLHQAIKALPKLQKYEIIE